jgi:DNA-binding GntR family transcriptional regulator
VLETSVIRHITSEIADSSIAAIEAISRKEKHAIETNNLKQILKLIRELHNYFSSLTQNEYLISSPENIQDLIEWVISITLEYRGRPQRAYEEHRAIIDMLQKRDTEKAVAMMENHLGKTLDEILAGDQLEEQ